MGMMTKPFSSVITLGRSTSKWEMGPNGRFVEYGPNEPAKRYDMASGLCVGATIHEGVTTLNTTSLVVPGPSSSAEVTDVNSIFEGKVAKKVQNTHESSSSVGGATNNFALPATGGLLDIFFESISDCRVAFGFRDFVVGEWDQLYIFNPVNQELTLYSGTASDILDVGVVALPVTGPNGGTVYRAWVSKIGQSNPGNMLAAYMYPGFEGPGFEGFRGSIVHYVGVTDVPYVTPPVWAPGMAMTRGRDIPYTDPIPAKTGQIPRALYVEMSADGPSSIVTDQVFGGVGFVRTGGSSQDRAWIAYRGGNADSPRGQVVSPDGGSSQLGNATVPNGDLCKAVLTWNQNSGALAVNGEDDAGVAAGVIPGVDRDRLTIGWVITSNRIMNGVIKKIRVYPQYWDLETRLQRTAL